MKKTGLILLVAFLLFSMTGCIKDTSCKPKSAQSEQATIEAYALANGINAVQLNNTGLYYEVGVPGSGSVPNSNSIISATYTGKLLDGTVFDSRTTPQPFQLNGVIAGWQLGIPLIKKGGTIKLIIPSSLAYGCTGRGSIPGDAVLFFEIQLTDVQ